MSLLRPHVALATSRDLQSETLVVLDTNAVLDVSRHSTGWYEAKWAHATPVVPPIVLAELATKTHREGYLKSRPDVRALIVAARSSVVLLSGRGHPWPTQRSHGSVVGFPTAKLWAALSLQRQCAVEDCASDWVTWTSGDESGRRRAVPAMADHQVLATAWGLKQDGFREVHLLSSDRELATAARHFGVCVSGVPR